MAESPLCDISWRVAVGPSASRYRPVLRGMLICGDEVRYLRHDPSDESEMSDEPLWWPPHKVAGRYLAHYLASRAELGLPAMSGAGA